MALFDSMAADDFDISVFKDSYADNLAALIEAKINGKQVVVPAAEEPPQVINLMEALRQSVARVQETNGAKKEPRKSTRRLVRKIS